MAPRRKPKIPTGGSSSQHARREWVVKTFTKDEIIQMTQNFQNLCGTGRYAQVYKGELEGEVIAVKVYPREHAQLAKNETNALSDLTFHRHIIPLKGICTDDEGGFHYLVMKFVSNDLHELLTSCELKWHETLKILQQLAHGIKGVIKEDYVVADIKPNNILINEDLEVFLCDFGSARKGGIGLPTVNMLYTANEVYKNATGSPAADIYSFGCIVLQMIMRYNEFDKRIHRFSLQGEVNAVLRAGAGKKSKKARNSSNHSNPHISVQARCLLALQGHGHLVHKRLIQSGCDEDDAKKVTDLGIKCTNEDPNARPSIEEIISTIEQLKA